MLPVTLGLTTHLDCEMAGRDAAPQAADVPALAGQRDLDFVKCV